MNDHELLELAAKASDIEIINIGFANGPNYKGTTRIWNPLHDDGDALRLAVKLGLCANITEEVACVEWGLHDSGPCGKKLERLSGDPYAATRRAIVRAAAEIGKNLDTH